MAVYAYPTFSHFVPEKADMGIRSNVMMSISPLNGAMQTIEVPGSRWVTSLTYSAAQSADLRAEIEAFWARVRGQVHRVSLWHFRRPEPRGTIRGASPTLGSNLALGATSCAFNGLSNGQTLLPGDLFGIGGQLLMCTNQTAVTAVGSAMSGIQFSPPLRADASAGAPVQLVRPSANFILTEPEVRVPYEGYGVSAFTVDLMEFF